MISRAIEARVPFAWFTADEAYGQAKYLRAWLVDQDVSHVVAIRCSDTFTTSAGEQRADALIAAGAGRAWQRLSTGAGAHGPREFGWARSPSQPVRVPPRALAAGPPLHQRPGLDRLLRLLRPAPVQACGPGLDRRLLISLLQSRAPDPGHVWSWSAWRRRRQYQARRCHYRRRGYSFA
jgi:hypothetical protein